MVCPPRMASGAVAIRSAGEEISSMRGRYSLLQRTIACVEFQVVELSIGRSTGRGG